MASVNVLTGKVSTKYVNAETAQWKAEIMEREQAANIRISIITVTYNSGKTLKDTLESIKCQQHKNIEHIIIDGNSKDDTLNIIKAYPHVSKCISEKDSGIYDAMNKGLKLATGDVIGILNSDDFYAHEYVLSNVAICFSHYKTDTVYGDLQYVNAKNVNAVVRNWKSGVFKPSSFYYGWMPPHPTFFVRRAVYEQSGLFNLSLKSSADYELMLRVLLKEGYKTTYLPQVLVKMRTGGISNASIKNRLRANNEDKKAWQLNGLHPYFFTLYLKPVRKVFQYI
jgi:glycosyltransferase involved in cell wall biosynthesis